MPTLKQLTEDRVKHVNDARGILDKATAEKREMTTEESQAFDGHMADADKLKGQIDTQHQSDERSKRLARHQEDLDTRRGRVTEPSAPGRGASPGESGSDSEPRRLTLHNRGNTRRGESRDKPRVIDLVAGTAMYRRAGEDYAAAVRSYMAGESRALQTDLDVSGGYIVTHEQFVAELIKDIDDEVYMRQLARKFTTDAQSIGAPRRTAKASTFNWGGELTAPTADTALKFGKRALTPHYMTGQLLVSRDLMRSAVMNPEDIVREEIARDSNELEERAYMTGSGSQQPLGVFTASADGISTARDISTDNTSTNITADGLINALYFLKQVYRRNATWMFHRDVVRNVRKLKDSTNQYLWQVSIQAGQPDTLLNRPLVESEWVPNTLTTGLYVGIVGDFSNYWIVDNLGLELLRQDELFSQTNQVGFLARRKVDGAPVKEEAFARVKLG